MKFLCVECDEAMILKRIMGPEEGCMTILFTCPNCRREMAMLTNSMETQMVQALNVKIGGKSPPSEPMEMVRNALLKKPDQISAIASGLDSPEQKEEQKPAVKCPFSEVISEAIEGHDSPVSQLAWTPEAETRLERIPSFIRPMARKSIEQYALEKGYREVNGSVMDEVKDCFGM